MQLQSAQSYEDFLQGKRITAQSVGFDVTRESLNCSLFDFQKDITSWGLKRGRSALFMATGTGKTICQLEWAHNVVEKTGKNILLLAPLAVSRQTKREGEKFGINTHVCRTQDDVKPGINITNYEMLSHFNPEEFIGIVLDESSIIKSFEAKTRTEIINAFECTPYKLACTATPAPNDYMELGNHAEFLNVMTRTEMLSMFFVHDGGDTSKWRLKGHAISKFWEWVASWACMITMPSDLGYDNGKFELPPLNYFEHVVPGKAMDGTLFATSAQTLMERRQARAASIESRVKKCADIVTSDNEQHLIWCDLNKESEMLARAIPDAVEVKGSDSPEHKEKSLLGFADGSIKRLITKPSIAGFGLNWQTCHNMSFVGLSDSWEAYYQAVRRCWRFGQEYPVNVNIITSENEGAVVANIKRKEADALTMQREMLKYTAKFVRENVRNAKQHITEYHANMPLQIPAWCHTQEGE